MNNQTNDVLHETLEERAGVLLVPAPAAAELVDRARRGHRRRTALATAGGGAATAAAVLVGVLVAPSATPQRPAGPASSQTPTTTSTSALGEAPLTIDQATRANAVHDWATALPPGGPVTPDRGYRATRQGDRIVIEIGGRQGVLPRFTTQEGDARSAVPQGFLSNPVKVADGWLFMWHPSVADVAQRVLHVTNELDITVVAHADEIWQVVGGPAGRLFAVVSGAKGPDGVVRYAASVHSLDSSAVRRVELRDWQEPTIATWHGDLLTLPSPAGASSALRSYDLGSGRWVDVPAPPALGNVSGARVVALPGSQGGDPSKALIAVEHGDGTECLHVVEDAVIAPGPLGCADGPGRLVAKVGPGARYVLTGDGDYGRADTDHAAKVLDVRTLREVAGIPAEVVAVGVTHLYWEDDHTVIGQANRAAPVHASEALFRWDLETSSGESLAWDPARSLFSSFTVGGPDEPAMLPGG